MANVIKRGNSYRITVSLGYDVFGKKIRETTTFTPDPKLTPKQEKKALDAFIYEFEKAARDGQLLSGRKLTLQAYSEKWIKDYAKMQVQPATLVRYEYEIYNKLLPALGHLKLSDIKPIHIQAFYNNLLEDGVRKDNKNGGYSSASIRKYHNILNIMLKTAVKWQIIDSNPCDRVTIPKQAKQTESIKFFTTEQALCFLSLLESDLNYNYKGHSRIDDTGKSYTVEEYSEIRKIPLQFKVFFNLAIFGGFRNGELLALTWEDVDFTNNTVSISKSVSLVKGQHIIKEPKTKNSIRTVTLPISVIKLLKQHKIQQAELILKLGDYRQDSNFLFTQDNGKLMHYHTPYHTFKKLIKYYNENIAGTASEFLPNIPLHGLRHTSATLLISEQVDIRTVSARLGHAQTSTTMNIYAHALKENDKTAAEKLGELLKKNA